MDKTKITKREMFTELRSLVKTSSLDNATIDRMLNFIDHEITLLDKRSAKAKEWQAKQTDASTDALSETIQMVLAAHAPKALTIKNILDSIVDPTDVTAQKIVYRLNQMPNVTKTTVTIDKRHVNAYSIPE